jgi:hypothetical protein
MPTTSERQTDRGKGELYRAVERFWPTYYDMMLKLHTESRKGITEPIKDRNLGTTAAKHVTVLEDFWADQLASAIGVHRSEVGKRKVKLAPHKSKSFDVCWPKTGDPKVLISVKSMQNAYRNLTNRIEEACGDSAVLRLYRSNAVFGFFFFVLDGNVPRGKADQGKKIGQGRKGVAPYLDLVEEGGDFFDLAEVESYRKPPKPPPIRPPKKPPKTKTRQDAISVTEMVLMDLASETPAEKPSFLYDSIAYVPTRIKNTGSNPNQEYRRRTK